MSEGMSSAAIKGLLRAKHSGKRGEWACFQEFRNSTGHSYNVRTIDLLAMALWPSAGFRTVAYEVKVSRADFMREIQTPSKRKDAEIIAHECYFAMPAGLVKADEIPDGWGLIEANAGIEPNPLYARGFSRVGCLPCIMCRKDEIKRIGRLFPSRIERIRLVEADGMTRECNTFFSPSKVPRIWRSRTVTTKDGRRVTVATIDDVLAWSETTKGGKQRGFDFDEEPPACSHTSGACE